MSYLNMILEEAFKDRDPGRFPFSFGVEVTNFCNLRCPMCPREIADRGYVLASGSVVLEGDAATLRDSGTVERAYLGTRA